MFRLEVKTMSRSDGRTAIGSAAYRSCSKLVEDATGIVHDYAKKEGHVFNTIIQPDGDAPLSSSEIWNHAESLETRKNSTVAREFLLTLPRDLPKDIQQQMTVDFTHWLVQKYSFRAEVNIHNPTINQRKKYARYRHVEFVDTGEQPHAHILVTTRDIFGEKTRALDDKYNLGPQHIAEAKEQWRTILNHEYKRHGIDTVITFENGKVVYTHSKDNAERSNVINALILENNAAGEIQDELRALHKTLARQERMSKFQHPNISSSKSKKGGHHENMRTPGTSPK